MAMAAVEPNQAIPRDSAEAADHIARFTSEIVREALTVRALVDTLRGAKKFIEQAARAGEAWIVFGHGVLEFR
jgi:hypothetical protein